MKKIILLFVVLVFASLALAQDALQLFSYTDNFTLVTPLFLNDGTTPIPDGYLVEICIPVAPDTYDFENDPNGAMLNNTWGFDFMNGLGFFGMEGFFYANNYFVWEDPVGTPPEPVANCGDQVYLRIYDAPDAGSATWYMNSGFITGPNAGDPPQDTEVLVWEPWEEIGGGPLPVVLSDFATAVFENEFVQISWTTQSSANMNVWNLIRDDLIIHTEAAVNGTETHEYIYEDIYVTVGETYTYYLEAVDNDGTTTMFGPVTAQMTGEEIPVMPEETLLKGNYPNPFNPVTAIKFDVKAGENATLTIFDIKGRIVETATYGPGIQSHTWEANTSASGVYFYKLESQSTTSVKKMMLLK